MPIIAVKGTHDVLKEEAAAYEAIERIFVAACSLYGYSQFRTPIAEYTELFSRSTGEGSDVVRKEMYTFQDKAGRSITLRPEFTAGIARAILEHKLYATEDLPIKCFYYGPSFRYERPQLGRYRQFEQAGVECIGEDSEYFDAEVVCLALTVLGLLGFEDVKVKVNTLGDKESRAAYKEALVSYFSDKIDGMCEDCHERLRINPLRILDCKVPEDKKIALGAPKMKDYLSEQSEKRFYKTLSILNDAGIDYEIDDGLVRGLDYYGELVFEVSVASKEGKDYGAVLGGGHYDSLLKDLGGPELSGVGFAFGVERLYSLMKDNGLIEGEEYDLDFFIIPIGEEVLPDAFGLATMVRSMGFSCFAPNKAGKLGSMFKKAVRRKAKFALILGEEELERGEVKLKNLETEEQKSLSLERLEEELDALFEDEEEEEHHHH